MPASSDTVLVTGASGFIASHVILQLRAAGYRVRGTVRSEAKAESLRTSLAAAGARGVDLVLADLTSDDGWDAAVEGCRYVLHVASPLPNAPPRHEDDLIVPARDGALRVLEAAARAEVERVVMTSSIAAVVYGHRDRERVFDESDWSDLTGEIDAYGKSKTLAEQAAWAFMAQLPEGHPLTLAVINPGLVLGPVLGRDFSTSGEVVRKLMAGEVPGCPDVGWAVVDVRDVARAHLSAMTRPDAAGQRFVCAQEHVSMREIAELLKDRFEPEGFHIPTRRVPSWLFKLVALFDRTTRLALVDLGKRQHLSSERAQTLLGFTPRPIADMVADMGASMIAHRVV